MEAVLFRPQCVEMTVRDGIPSCTDLRGGHMKPQAFVVFVSLTFAVFYVDMNKHAVCTFSLVIVFANHHCLETKNTVLSISYIWRFTNLWKSCNDRNIELPELRISPIMFWKFDMGIPGMNMYNVATQKHLAYEN